MTTLPRRRLLDIWRALAARCAARSADPSDPWPSGDSVRDAEQLVCLLYPAMKMPGLEFADPDTTGPDVLTALAALGDHREIPASVTEICLEYLAAYTDGSSSDFGAPGQLRTLDAAEQPTEAQQRLETVESFSIAVTLSLSVLAFAHACERRMRAAATRERLHTLRRAASSRLTHAMTALRESFVADTFPQDSDKGRALVAAAFPGATPDPRRVRDLLRELRPIRLGLRGLDFPDLSRTELGDDDMLFTCGWTWGRAVSGQPDDAPGYAVPRPSLYFTVAAMDGIVDLFSSQQTLLPGLLNDHQLALAQQLLVRWELAQRYWSVLARCGGDWPLRDVPWRGSDGDESDYATLHMVSMVVHNFMRQGGPDERPPSHELRPLVAVLDELSARAKITRRAVPDDPAIGLHAPGVTAPLYGAERLGPPVGWVVNDFTPVLLKRTLQVASLTRDMEHRDTMLALAGELTDHLWNRRLDSGPASGLWDMPERVYPSALVPPAGLSWHITERSVETLVVAAAGIAAELAPSQQLVSTAADLLREADHLLAREMLTRTMHAPTVDSELHLIGVVLRRSRRQAERRPAVAIALACDALRRLDELSAAREQAARGVV
ncbi:SCO2524 family protein [Yinghuangia sp. YIM S10712]|uniref:SCO2524 family protein n=1 Tax=Yinghuangia sp. YIM S10712 TaxID=3436930 RepID=UPI003F53A610